MKMTVNRLIRLLSILITYTLVFKYSSARMSVEITPNTAHIGSTLTATISGYIDSQETWLCYRSGSTKITNEVHCGDSGDYSNITSAGSGTMVVCTHNISNNTAELVWSDNTQTNIRVRACNSTGDDQQTSNPSVLLYPTLTIFKEAASAMDTTGGSIVKLFLDSLVSLVKANTTKYIKKFEIVIFDGDTLKERELFTSVWINRMISLYELFNFLETHYVFSTRFLSHVAATVQNKHTNRWQFHSVKKLLEFRLLLIFVSLCFLWLRTKIVIRSCSR